MSTVERSRTSSSIDIGLILFLSYPPPFATGYEPSFTSVISSATRPCASRWTASAASLSGASARHHTSPVSSLNQYLWYLTPYSSWISMSFLWASATASTINPSTPLWWSMNSGIALYLLSPPSPRRNSTDEYDRTSFNNGSSTLAGPLLAGAGFA